MIVLILFPFFLTFTNDIHTQCNICLKYLHFCQFLNISIGCHNKLSWCVQTFLLHCITFYYAQREISWRPGKTSKFRPIHSTIQIWTYFHESEANFFFFFGRKKFKMAKFSKWPFFKIPNFRSVHGLVGLIDAKAINVAQPTWQ